MSTPLPACDDARPPIAHLLKGWRRTRKISQLELSLSAGISQRQLSFIESGRARLGRDTVLHLAEALNLLFERHEPNPALLVDRQTNFLCANRAASRVFGQYGDLESMPGRGHGISRRCRRLPHNPTQYQGSADADAGSRVGRTATEAI